jgi:hypothetical protein
VIVRLQIHARTPDDVQDREVVSDVDTIEAGTRRFTNGGEQCVRIGDGPFDKRLHGRTRICVAYRDLTIVNELFDIEHACVLGFANVAGAPLPVTRVTACLPPLLSAMRRHSREHTTAIDERDTPPGSPNLASAREAEEKIE